MAHCTISWARGCALEILIEIIPTRGMESTTSPLSLLVDRLWCTSSLYYYMITEDDITCD